MTSSHRPAADRRSGRRNPGDRRTVPPAAHRGTADPVRTGRQARPYPRVSAPRIIEAGLVEPSPGPDRRREPDAQHQGPPPPFRRSAGAALGPMAGPYRGPDGIVRPADHTFPDKTAAEVWLTRKEAEILDGDWLDPDAGRIFFGEYAPAWIDERPDLRPKTVQLYRYLLRRHLTGLGTRPIAGIREPQVRRWRKELLDAGVTKSPWQGIPAAQGHPETAVDDGLISRNPCRIRGASRTLPRTPGPDASPRSTRWPRPSSAIPGPGPARRIQ